MFLDLEKFALEVLVYGYCGCFNGFSKIWRRSIVKWLSVFETIRMQKKKNEEKYTLLVSRK